MRTANPFWLSTTTASNDPVDGDTAFADDAPAELYWSEFYGEPYYWFDLREWTAEDHYNYFDLDAVEYNTETVAILLSEYIGTPVPVDIYTGRTTRRFEFYDSMNRIEGNQQTLADNFYEPIGWEKPKLNWRSGRGGGEFSYVDANRLERNLYLIYNLIVGAIDSLKYCGTFYAGEDGDIY